MIQSIIPPILVILSVIGIIIFLVKKAPEINRLEREDEVKKNHGSRKLDNENGSGTILTGESEIASKVKHGLLVFLEKIVKRFRILFLKLETILKTWGEGIRKKRSSHLENQTGGADSPMARKDYFSGEVPPTRENEAIDGIENKINNYVPEKRSIREKMELKQKAVQEDIEEKYYRPIISDHVVVPKRRREIKSRLEELLIERIAANPKDIEAYERLGEYYLEVKNIEHSKECFKQVLRLNPTNRNARYKIRKLEKILGS